MTVPRCHDVSTFCLDYRYESTCDLGLLVTLITVCVAILANMKAFGAAILVRTWLYFLRPCR